jgi:phage FluMu protein Com
MCRCASKSVESVTGKSPKGKIVEDTSTGWSIGYKIPTYESSVSPSRTNGYTAKRKPRCKVVKDVLSNTGGMTTTRKVAKSDIATFGREHQS